MNKARCWARLRKRGESLSYYYIPNSSSFVPHRRLETIKFTQEILKSVYELYVPGKEGATCIESIAENLGLNELLHPKQKVSVMIIGNHSAGKSSFINWYCEDEVQKTSMAIETQGFTIITSGFKAAPPLKGEATLMRYPHIKPLKKKFGKGLMENLTTRVSASKAKQFPLVDFIDTPGLVDGEVSYPMDVNNVILKLADYADLGQCCISYILCSTSHIFCCYMI